MNSTGNVHRGWAWVTPTVTAINFLDMSTSESSLESCAQNRTALKQLITNSTGPDPRYITSQHEAEEQLKQHPRIFEMWVPQRPQVAAKG